MDGDVSRVFVLLDDNGYIDRLEGEYSLPNDLTDWIFVEEGEPCDRLNLAQTHYLPKPLFGTDGTHNYKYVDDEIVETTESEKAEERASFPPAPATIDERVDDLEAQLSVADETAIELYEYTLAQEEINNAQDEALIELYELVGGM